MVKLNSKPVFRSEDDSFTIESYSNRDPVVTAHFKPLPPDDIGLELDRVLALGVRVMQMATPAVTIDEIHGAFGGMTEKQRELLESANKELRDGLTDVLKPLIGDGGTLSKTLKQTEEVIERELRKYLDEDSAKSVAATAGKRVGDELRLTERRIDAAFREALDSTDESKGIGKIFKAIQSQEEHQAEQFAKLMAEMSAIAARKAERSLSTRKGDDYETGAFEVWAHIASVHGDSAERTAKLNGDARRNRGDFVSLIDERITGDVAVRITAEAMNRDPSKLALQSVLKELDEAKENRSAVAAIAIVSSAGSPAAAGGLLHRHPGNRYVCVLDGEGWFTAPLELAYAAARIDALSCTKVCATEGVDIGAASALVDEALGHLSLLDKARTKLGVIRTGVQGEEEVLSELEGKLVRCLSKLSSMLNPTS